MKKAPPMPKVAGDPNEVERHTAYTRLNPKGDKELVVGDDEETLNELAESLQECAEEYIWHQVSRLLPERIIHNAVARRRIDDAIGNGASPEEIVAMFESVSFSGPLPTGGGAGSPEQLQTDRRWNRLVSADGDQEQAAGEDLNNMTSSTPQAADGPELSRAKSSYRANARGNESPIKNIAGHRGTNVTYAATQSESFTGTGAIAIPPGGYTVDSNSDDDDEDDDKPEDSQMESTMAKTQLLTNDIDRILMEWEPSFKAGEYDPGDYQMPSPVGDGVAKRNPSKNTVGSYETDTSNQGKEWPRQHNETPAMCDVDDDGVEGKPQGVHQSSHAEATDGHQDKMGHNWPNQPQNSGSGVAEPFKGNRWSDGGTLKGSAPDEGNVGGGTSMPKEGPITGTSGPQMGQPQESWNPQNIGTLMEDEFDLQSLFDSYASDHGRIVCLEDFQLLCNAHGVAVDLDNRSLLQLMEDNQEFLFYQGEDADGLYWQPTPLAEGKPFPGAAPPFHKGENDHDDDAGGHDDSDDNDGDDDCPMSEGENRSPFGNVISEVMVRGAEQEAMPTGVFGDGLPVENEWEQYDEMGHEDEMIDNPHHREMEGECPTCGHHGPEEVCPGCGAEMELGHEEDVFGAGGMEPHYGTPEDIDDEDEFEMLNPPNRGSRAKGLGESMVKSPAIMESLQNFMSAAQHILGNNRNFARGHIAEALNYSWVFHAGDIDARGTPTKVQQTLQNLMQSFPGFDPLMESGSDAINKANGTAIGTGGGPNNSSSFLAEKDQPGPSDMADQGEPLGKQQKNTFQDTPIVKGTEKGMDGKGSVPQAVKENVARLSRHVQKELREGAGRSLRGNYGLVFTLLVNEGDQINRTPARSTMAEALADAEELLQLYQADDVMLEATFTRDGEVALKQNIELPNVRPRGLMVSEGMAIFRFGRIAEDFADELVSEGVTCRVLGHNWGRAVSANVTHTLAETAFRMLTEKKKKWMQKVKHTGECTPMTKSTCTGRKKAFAKRVHKGGDLYQEGLTEEYPPATSRGNAMQVMYYDEGTGWTGIEGTIEEAIENLWDDVEDTGGIEISNDRVIENLRIIKGFVNGEMFILVGPND